MPRGTAVLLAGALLAACGGGEKTPAYVDVRGRVVGIHGRPLANVKVSVAGGAAVVTGADGTFSADHVKVPYDALIGVPSAASGFVAWGGAWLGLRRADPVLVALTPFAEGPVTGGTVCTTFAAGSATRSVAGIGSDGLLFDASADCVYMALRSGTTEMVSLRAITLTYDARPGGFAGYGTQGSAGPVSLSPDQHLDLPPMVMSPVGTLWKDVTISAPDASETTLTGQVTYAGVRLQRPYDGATPVPTNASPPWKIPIPDAGPARLRAEVLASFPDGRYAVASRTFSAADAGGGAWAVSLPGAFGLTSPAPDGTLPRSGALAWKQPVPGLVSVVELTPGNGIPFAIVTGGESVAVPDFSLVGVPVGRNLYWRVTGIGPNATVDDHASAEEFGLGYLVPQSTAERVYTSSTWSTFSFAP
ncbi:MAG: hypothetical protein QM704_00275 [Anaeromyxobacteraceae bacterium]